MISVEGFLDKSKRLVCTFGVAPESFAAEIEEAGEEDLVARDPRVA